MAEVTLDIAGFRSAFPKFADETKTTDAEIEQAWYAACSFCDPTDANQYFRYEPDGTPPRYDRRIAIHLAMCHILSMGQWGDGQNGALTNASQGSVSTAFNLIQGKTTTESFWMQTPCGQRYWMMLKPYLLGGRVYISRDFHPWG